MTDQAKDDWPTFAEELGRKGLTALEKYMERRQRGEITARELYIVTDVLFDAMSGLAPWKDVDLVQQVNEEIRQMAKKAVEARNDKV